MDRFKRLFANVAMAAVLAALIDVSAELAKEKPFASPRLAFVALGVVAARAAVGAALVALGKPLPVDKPPEV